VAGAHAIHSNPASEHLATGLFYLARGDAIRSEARSPQGNLSLSADIEIDSRIPDIAHSQVGCSPCRVALIGLAASDRNARFGP
jgi:hypothetical protein